MASKILVNLDTSKDTFLNSKCKQNDDLTLIANIFENGLPKDLTNCSIVIQALKADRTYIIQNTEIAKSDNKITANLVRDFTRLAGETEIEIVLTEGSKQNTTFSFCLKVVRSVIKGAVESDNSITMLENLQEKINEARPIVELLPEAKKVRDETEELLKKGSAATKSEVKEVNDKLEKVATKLEDYVTPQLFGAKCDGKTDDTKAFQDAIDYAKRKGINKVFVPAGTYVITTILIPKFFAFEGVGRGSILIQSNNATSDIIKFEQGSCFSAVRGFKLQGTYDVTKATRHGVCLTDYVNENGYFDSGNIVENIYISDVTGDGVYLGWNQRGCRLENIDITRCNKAGIRLHGSDNSVNYCNVSVCREEDIMNDWGGWNNRIIGCKGFHAGVDNTATNVNPDIYMARILGNYNHIFSDMQESVGGALRLQGAGNKIDLMIDACGKKSYETGQQTTIIKVDENSIGNNIKANIIDGTLNGYAKYLLDLSNKAFDNVIDITFTQSGDIEKRQGIELTKSAYHFSNTIKLNGVTRTPVIYEKIKFTSVNGNDGINILWNVQQEDDIYIININKSIDELNNNGWMYLCFNNKLNNDLVKEAKKHNDGSLQLQFDFDTNIDISDKYVIDVITFAGASISTDVFQRWTKKGTIYMSIPCKVLEEATEYNIAIGIRKMTDETNDMPETTMIKVSNLKISFGDFTEDKKILMDFKKIYEENKRLSTNDFTNEYKEKLDSFDETLKEVEDNAILKPKIDGTEGQFLMSNGDGTVSWTSIKNGNEVAY